MEQLTLPVIAECPEINNNKCKLVCGFCFDGYRDPRILPCGHSFCLKCLRKQVDSTDKSQRLTCGLCRSPWQQPDDGLSALPKNFAIPSNSPESESPSRLCAMEEEGDEHGEVEYFCVDCADALCASCFDGHRRTKLTKTHVVLPISEAADAEGYVGDSDVSKAKEGDLHLPNCAAHPDQFVTQYCTQCDDVICRKCAVTSPSHAKWHKCVEFKDADKTFVLKIGRLLADLRQQVKDATASLKISAKSVKNAQDEQARLTRDVESIVSEARSNLQEAYEKCVKSLEACKTAALADVDKLADEEKGRLEMEQKCGTERLHKLHNTISLSEGSLTPYTSTTDRWKLAKKLTTVVKETTVSKRSEDSNNNSGSSSSSKFQQPDFVSWKGEMRRWGEGVMETLSRDTPPPLTPALLTAKHFPGQPHSRTLPPPHIPVFGALLSKVIQIPQLKVCNRAVDVLSILKECLLVSDYMAPELFVYNILECSQRSLIVPGKMRDAVYLPTTGNIICSTGNNRKVTTLSSRGDVISDVLMTDPHRLSVCEEGDGVEVYLADSELGVYESRNAGLTWTLLFKLPDFAWRCWQVIKIRKDECDVFWSLESKDGACRLREYRIDEDVIDTASSSRDCHVTWRDVSTSPSPGVDIDLHYAHLAYDGAGNIFLSDFNNSTVHVYSISGQHQRQLLSLRDGLDGPRSLAVDRGQKLLCVGQRKGEVKVFVLSDGRRQSLRPSLSAMSMSDMSQPASGTMMRRQSSTPSDIGADALASLLAKRVSFDIGSPTSPVPAIPAIASLAALSRRPSVNDFVPTSIARRPGSPLARRGSLFTTGDVSSDDRRDRPQSPLALAREGAANFRY